jgi:hypothetical protein
MRHRVKESRCGEQWLDVRDGSIRGLAYLEYEEGLVINSRLRPPSPILFFLLVFAQLL